MNDAVGLVLARLLALGDRGVRAGIDQGGLGGLKLAFVTPLSLWHPRAPARGVPPSARGGDGHDGGSVSGERGIAQPGAALKLGAAGLALERFTLGAYGSDSGHRPDLPPIAAERAAAHFGRVPSGAEVVILGDTPADVTCGNSIGARAIGVATGAYSREELLAAGAYAAFDTLADTEAVLQAIF